MANKTLSEKLKEFMSKGWSYKSSGGQTFECTRLTITTDGLQGYYVYGFITDEHGVPLGSGALVPVGTTEQVCYVKSFSTVTIHASGGMFDDGSLAPVTFYLDDGSVAQTEYVGSGVTYHIACLIDQYEGLTIHLESAYNGSGQ